MAFNLESFKAKLLQKGLRIVSSTNEVTVGLIWGVEGVEKVKGLGDVLFYVVNGTRYGVKPKRGNKHDTDWYYKQLKMGMQGAKAYHAGLTQFLNTWIKKGELQVVFKGKATASACAKVTADRAQIVDEEMKKKFEDFQKKVQDISFFGKKPFVCYVAEKYGEIYVFIETEKRITITSDNQEEIDNVLKRYNYMNLSSDPNEAALIYDPKDHIILFNDAENGCTYQMISLDTINFDKVYEALKRDCKDIENAVRSVIGFKVTASTLSSKDIKDVLDSLKMKYMYSRNPSFEFWSANNNKILIGLKDGKDVSLIINHKKMSNPNTKEELYNAIKEYRVTAENLYDVDALIDGFIEDVNALRIKGKQVFSAVKKNNDIVIKLLIKSFTTDNEERLNETIQDKLSIIFPITQVWLNNDRTNTLKMKAGDITMYTDEWSSQEFGNEFIISTGSSKIDFKNFEWVLSTIYSQLKHDCDVLSNYAPSFTVTAAKDNIEESLEGINQEHDRLMFLKVSAKDFINLWRNSTKFNPNQLKNIIFGFKLASRTLASKFENSGIKIEYFFKRKDGKGYIRVEYKDELYIIYVAQSDDNGDIKVVTRKMKKMIPVKNFNLLSTSVSSLAFENATLPTNFKKVWEEVTKD